MNILKGKSEEEILKEIDNTNDVSGAWCQCIDRKFLKGIKKIIREYGSRYVDNDIEYATREHPYYPHSTLYVLFLNKFGIGALTWLGIDEEDEELLELAKSLYAESYFEIRRTIKSFYYLGYEWVQIKIGDGWVFNEVETLPELQTYDSGYDTNYDIATNHFVAITTNYSTTDTVIFKGV